MDRRRFLEFSGLATLGLIHAACASTVVPEETDAAATPDVPPIRDAQSQDAWTAAPDTVTTAAFVIHEAFTVLLNDTSCSGHDHAIDVIPGAYMDDTPVHFLGGSHELVFRPSELVQLEQGDRLPFATIGNGPGHGHCGLAWRTNVGPASRTRVDVCMPRGTAMCIR